MSKKDPAPKGFLAKDYVRPGLNEDEINEIKEAFDLFDADGGGSIDPKKLKNAMSPWGSRPRTRPFTK